MRKVQNNTNQIIIIIIIIIIKPMMKSNLNYVRFSGNYSRKNATAFYMH
jgi:hypothetical protein